MNIRSIKREKLATGYDVACEASMAEVWREVASLPRLRHANVAKVTDDVGNEAYENIRYGSRDLLSLR